ncbi:hypothetical protein [Salinispira pacifica]
MPLQPIDLQTLFVRLQQVGQDQAAIKDAAAQAQSVAGQEIAQKSTQQQSRVTETPELQNQLENVNDKERREREREEEKKHRKEQQDGPESELFRDPDLGQNIDISG